MGRFEMKRGEKRGTFEENRGVNRMYVGEAREDDRMGKRRRKKIWGEMRKKIDCRLKVLEDRTINLKRDLEEKMKTAIK